MPKAKPFSTPIEESVARQVLNSTGCTVEVNGQAFLLGDALMAASEQLRECVVQANVELENNKFSRIVAEHLADELGRRGEGDIAVTDSGTVMLYINYPNSPHQVGRQAQRGQKLPLMKALKNRAAQLGVEIPVEFGIKRSKIAKWLDQVETGDLTVPKKSRSQRPQPKKAQSQKVTPMVRKNATIKVAEDPPETDSGPMSAGPDETKMSPPLDETALPKKRGFVKTSEAIVGPVVVSTEVVTDSPTLTSKETKTPKSVDGGASTGDGKSMRQLVEDSKDVSIADLLASDPPK